MTSTRIDNNLILRLANMPLAQVSEEIRGAFQAGKSDEVPASIDALCAALKIVGRSMNGSASDLFPTGPGLEGIHATKGQVASCVSVATLAALGYLIVSQLPTEQLTSALTDFVAGSRLDGVDVVSIVAKHALEQVNGADIAAHLISHALSASDPTGLGGHLALLAAETALTSPLGGQLALNGLLFLL